MTESIKNEKLPWPSRLSNLSKRSLILGIIICVLGLPLGSILGEIGGVVMSFFGAGIIAFSVACGVISLIGLLCYKYKIPGTGRAIGVIVIGWHVFALAVAVLGPSLSASTQQKFYKCMGNLKNLSCFCVSYNAEHKLCPTPEKWCDLIKPYSQDKDKNYFQCPKDKTGPCSYAMNKNIPADANDLPPDLVVLFESAPGWNQTGGPEDVVIDRHDRPGANIAFADGTVKFVKTEEIPKLRWTIEQK